jgi:hypothetical protein
MDFDDLKYHKDLIIKGFYSSLNPSISKQLSRLSTPYISVHIRRGDFNKSLNITPIDFYIKIVLLIREVVCWDVPVTVFTDANNHEISPIFKLSNVSFATPKNDILDLIEMSKSKVLIAAARSTFSYWACFLGKSIVVKYENEWFNPLRLENEGGVDEWIFNENEFNDFQKQRLCNELSKP